MELFPSRVSQESQQTVSIQHMTHISLIFSHLAAHAAASALFITAKVRESETPAKVPSEGHRWRRAPSKGGRWKEREETARMGGSGAGEEEGE